jgi:hypothetical protein
MDIDQLNVRFGDVLWHIDRAHTYSTDNGNLINETEMLRAKHWVRRIYDFIIEFGQDTQDKKNWEFGKKCLSLNATYVALVLIQKTVIERDPIERCALPGDDIDSTKYSALRIVQFFKSAKNETPQFYRFRCDREAGSRMAKPTVSTCQFANNKRDWKDRAVTVDFLLNMAGAGSLPTQVHCAQPPPPPRTDGFMMSEREKVRRFVVAKHDERQLERKELKRAHAQTRADFLESLSDDDIRKKRAHNIAMRMAANKKARMGSVTASTQHDAALRAALDLNFNKPDLPGATADDENLPGLLRVQFQRAEQQEVDFDPEQHAMDLGLDRSTDADAY